VRELESVRNTLRTSVLCGVTCVVEMETRVLLFFQRDLEELEKDFICMK